MVNRYRRALLGAAWGAATVAAAPSLRAQSAAAPPAGKPWARGTQLVLLGTMAGPVLHPGRAMSGQVLFVNGRGHLVDCGYGTIMRMTEMGIRLPELSQVYLTHHHSDHTADLPALLNMAWILGNRAQLGVHGPPPLQRLHAAALAAFDEDVQIRVRATGREPPSKMFKVNEVQGPGLVYEDADVKVRAALADHAPFEVALAYRFDTAERSVVFSGDTAYSERVVELARDADVLVHEAMLVPAIDGMLAKRSYVPPALRRFLLQGHTTAEEAGRVAERAGVKTLVLSHLLPGDEPIDDAAWIAEAARQYRGRIVVARDKMVL